MPRRIALALASLLCCACAAEGPGAADDFHVRLYIAPRTALGGWAADSGSFIIRVSPALAPLGAARFRELVGSKFYDGAPFFRVIGGFMAQFGIAARPEVSRRWQDKRLKDDPAWPKGSASNTLGTISFAHGGVGTRTTQCFLNFGDNSRLDPEGFAVFGRVLDTVADPAARAAVASIYRVGESPPGGKGVEQGRLWQEGGLEYLRRSFPQLSYIREAVLVADPVAAPAGISAAAFGRKQGAVSRIKDMAELKGALAPADYAFERKNDKFLAMH